MTVSKQLIQNIEELRKSLNEISVYDFDVYTSMELYYKIANKLNEVIKELMRFEGLVSDEVVEQNEKLIYLLGEGLNEEVVKKIDQMVKDGTMNSIINTNLFNDLNSQINEKASKSELEVERQRINNLTSLPEGSTTGDAELIDIRVDGSGHTHSSAGDSVRCQFNLLNDNLSDYNNTATVLRNRVFSFVEGKWLKDNLEEVEAEDYGYAKIDINGGGVYTFSNSGSDAFSHLVDEKGVRINTTLSSCRLNDKAGYVYNFPTNSKYLYVGRQYMPKDIVAFKASFDIATNRYSYVDFPYNTAKIVVIKDLYVDYDKSIEEFTRDVIKNTQINYANTINIPSELLATKDGLSSWGSAIIEYKNNTVVAKCTQKNQGVMTSNISSPSDNVKIKIKGSVTNNNFIIDVLTCYHKNDGSTHWGGDDYHRIYPNSDGTFEFSTVIDFANLAVYQNMKDVFFIIRNNTDSVKGDIIIEQADVWEMTELEKQDILGENLEDTIININTKINDVKNSVSTDNEDVEFKLISPNGNKSILTVQNDGQFYTIPTIPNKVLFVGNSLLWGMGSYGMCASSPRNDYAYHVQQAILAKNPSATFKKCHGAQFEQAESDTQAHEYWTTTANTITGRPASQSFTSDLDLIIMQVNDNVSNDIRLQTFTNNLDWLVQQIKNNSPRARIIWVDGWFADNRTHDIITIVCDKWKIPRINITDLNTKENQGYSGQSYEMADGSTGTVKDTWITHPGDEGFRKIAERIIKKLDM